MRSRFGGSRGCGGRRRAARQRGGKELGRVGGRLAPGAERAGRALPGRAPRGGRERPSSRDRQALEPGKRVPGPEELAEAQVCATRAVEVAREVGDERLVGLAVNRLGLVQTRHPVAEPALVSFTEARELFRRLGDSQIEGQVLRTWAASTPGSATARRRGMGGGARTPLRRLFRTREARRLAGAPPGGRPGRGRDGRSSPPAE